MPVSNAEKFKLGHYRACSILGATMTSYSMGGCQKWAIKTKIVPTNAAIAIERRIP